MPSEMKQTLEQFDENEDKNEHKTSSSEDEDESLLSEDDNEEIKAQLEGILREFPEIINFEDPDHNTLLIHSIEAENLNIFRYLLEKGANTFVSKNVFDIFCCEMFYNFFTL